MLNQIRPRIFQLAATALLLGACGQPVRLAPSDAPRVLAARTITAPNPALAGPLTVKQLFYGSGTDKRRPEYRDSITYRTIAVDASPFAKMEPAQARSRKAYWGFDNTRFPLNARVWYPAGDGPFPLVLVVHGNHTMKDFSDPGYAWLGELLASRGFILASIDENFLNGSLRNENDARAWMLLKHLDVFRALNDSVGKPLHGRIDMRRIALMGHSRGGEAVAIAGAFNRLPFYPDDATQRFAFNHDIRAIVAIAPVDGQYRPADQPTPVSDYSYLVIHGSHDGDVSSFMGLTQYNRLRYTTDSSQFKSAIWMYRANHGQWNTVWNNKDNGPISARALELRALISGEEQRQFGRVVISGFLEATLHARDEYRAIFRDHRRAGDWLPPTMYLTRYADAHSRFLATFDEDVDVTTGSAPGVRIAAESLSVWKESDTPARSRATTFRSNAVTVGWNNTPVGADTAASRAPAHYLITMPDSLRQAWRVGRRTALLFTMGTTDQRPGARPTSGDSAGDSATVKPPKPIRPDTAAPDFTVELEDRQGHRVRLPVSSFGPVRRPLETYVYRRRGRDKRQFPTLSEAVLYTYVAPLEQFAVLNAQFDASQLRHIRFVFDRSRQGVVIIDDVGVTVVPPA